MYKNIALIFIAILLSLLPILFLEKDSLTVYKTDLVNKLYSYPTPTTHYIDMRMVSGDEDKIFELVQKHRENLKKPRFILDQSLCDISKERADSLDNLDQHEGFKANKQKYFGSNGFDVIAENLTRNSGYAEDPNKYIFDRWLDSPKHKDAIEADYTHSCLKCGKALCVEIFGKY